MTRFSWTSWLLSKLDPKLSYGSTSTCFTENQQTWPDYLERSGWQTFCDFKEKHNKVPAFGHLSYQLPFFLFVCERRECPWSAHSTGDHHHPIGHYSQQPDLNMAQVYPPLPLSHSCHCPLSEGHCRIVTGSPLTIPVPHAVEALLNSPHTRYLSASRCTSWHPPANCRSYNSSSLQ